VTLSGRPLKRHVRVKTCCRSVRNRPSIKEKGLGRKMKPLHRTLLGLAIAAAMLPVLIGVLACIPALPVPIGDPNKSRIDPALTGIWFDVYNEHLWVIQPYDRRTYVVSLYDFDLDDCIDRPFTSPVDPDLTKDGDRLGSPDYAMDAAAIAVKDDDAAGSDELIEIIFPSRPEWYEGGLDGEAALNWYKDFVIAARQDCDATLDGREVYNSWLTRLGKRSFMTMELLGAFTKHATFSPGAWFVLRLTKVGDDAVQAELVDVDFEGFEAANELFEALSKANKPTEKLREDYETVISEHSDAPELTDSDEPRLLIRIPRHDLEYFKENIANELLIIN